MEQLTSDPAFLIRFRSGPGTEGASGLVTHVQSGRRFEFASFRELERFLKEQLASSGAPTADPEGDGGDRLV